MRVYLARRHWYSHNGEPIGALATLQDVDAIAREIDPAILSKFEHELNDSPAEQYHEFLDALKLVKEHWESTAEQVV